MLPGRERAALWNPSTGRFPLPRASNGNRGPDQRCKLGSDLSTSLLGPAYERGVIKPRAKHQEPRVGPKNRGLRQQRTTDPKKSAHSRTGSGPFCHIGPIDRSADGLTRSHRLATIRSVSSRLGSRLDKVLPPRENQQIIHHFLTKTAACPMVSVLGTAHAACDDPSCCKVIELLPPDKRQRAVRALQPRGRTSGLDRRKAVCAAPS